ncbi:hypothetical protein [Mucilaginibacter flavus]|uniref:hypothetical protein n=1 Tax=Mucilaginibacter flavus TaxID=931504 RepID=UPI0025B2BA4F|nr:hypothetical protein [Mucilaginibacter flavus]MDN3584413.1 hypothetical protein [Mucilaginibacter flavus]
MRKIIALLILLFSTVVLILAMDQALINTLKRDRYFDHLSTSGPGGNRLYHQILIRSDRWRYGDLFGLCYLPQYKFRLEPFKKYENGPAGAASGRVLYIIGDSYLADKSISGAFDGFEHVIFLDRRFPFGPVALDSTKQNVLIMEFAERNLVDYEIDRTSEQRWTQKDIAGKLNFRPQAAAPSDNNAGATALSERLNKILFNRELSRNLELLLFDDKMWTPLKELKASLNYQLFGRLPGEVAVSTDKKRLLMNITVDTSFRQSDFRTIPDIEINRLTAHLAEAKNYYNAIGFKAVYLAAIPNAASVYDDRRMSYNHLLERVERNNLFPVISVYHQFKRNPANLYYRSDTHWNPLGFDIWLTEADRVLRQTAFGNAAKY